ncbi:hypothetical protein [Acidithiobacillus acidisediminis]|uniref:hypothetical protein n=1 Tax=Acidithiobacillus sp. TaxID=1872118 RepID=UPI00201008B9|nr:hypothetical protein [Acidithiobacillus sp. S30A2]
MADQDSKEQAVPPVPPPGFGQGVSRKVQATLEQTDLKPPPGLATTWVVDCKGVGNGEKALVNLGRYLYRGVIQ